MTSWSQDFTVRSNARRAARKAGIDPAKVAGFVKAGKTLYRFPTTPEPKPTKAAVKPKAAKKAAAPKATKAAATKPEKFNDNTDFIRSFGKPSPAPAKAKSPKAASRGGLKFIAVAELLRRPQGASITEVVAATGWKPHSARARISVDVSKLLTKGEEIVRRREDGLSHYAIVKSKQLELPVEEAA